MKRRLLGSVLLLGLCAAWSPMARAQACVVNRDKELMIRDLSVVEDCCRTTFGACPSKCPATIRGAWTFKHLIEGVAGTTDPVVLHKFVMNWLNEWMAPQLVNGDTAPARTAINTLVIQPWLAASGGSLLNMEKAPFRLLAIVNRMDLRKVPSGYSQGNAGEGRFVFGVLDLNNPAFVPSFTVIFEYGLPANSCTDVKVWANDWHNLGTLPFGPTYNSSLQAITDRFTNIGSNPAKSNGSAINQIRSNEIALAGPWELREFRLQDDGVPATTDPLQQVTVKETPDDIRNGSKVLRAFINDNEAAILAGTISVPDTYLGINFLGAASENNIDFWSAPGIINNQARHLFSLNTCDACHGRETNTGFLHVSPRSSGTVAAISGFLGGPGGLGIDVLDPVDLVTLRHFNDLERRATDLCSAIADPCSKLESDKPLNRTH